MRTGFLPRGTLMELKKVLDVAQASLILTASLMPRPTMWVTGLCHHVQTGVMPAHFTPIKKINTVSPWLKFLKLFLRAHTKQHYNTHQGACLYSPLSNLQGSPKSQALTGMKVLTAGPCQSLGSNSLQPACCIQILANPNP